MDTYSLIMASIVAFYVFVFGGIALLESMGRKGRRKK